MKLRFMQRAMVAVLAIVAAVGLWAVVTVVFGVPISVPVAPGAAERIPLRLMPVTYAAIIVTLGAWGLLRLLERLGERGLRIWTWISVAVFVLTLPYMPGFTAGERVFLVALHGAMFAIVLIGMRRTSPVRGARPEP